MAPMKLLIVALTASFASAFTPSSFGVRQATQLHETFGIGIGEDTYANQPDFLKGEAEYKQYMNRVKEDNMLNRKVRIQFTYSNKIWNLIGEPTIFSPFSTVQCYPPCTRTRLGSSHPR